MPPSRHHYIPRKPNDLGPQAAERVSVPLGPEAVEMLKRLDVEFEHVFRRSPGPEDPVLFVFNLLSSVEELDEGTATILEMAGIPPELRYASMKTQRVVTEHNIKFLTPEEIQEWNDAVEEYFELEEQGRLTPRPNRYERAMAKLSEEFDRLPFVLSLFLRQGHQSIRGRSLNRDAAFFYLTKTLKSIQACTALTELHYDEDAFSLARSVFENYLQIVYAVRNPESHLAWITAHLGVQTGTHTFGTSKNGKPLYNVLVDKKTGQSISPVSRSSMAAMSPYDDDRRLYTLLYDMLSSYSHPDPARFLNYFSHLGFDAAQRAEDGQPQIIACFLAVLNLDAILHLGNHPPRARRDAQVLLTHIRRKAASVFRSTELKHPIIAPLASRVAKIGQTWPIDAK